MFAAPVGGGDMPSLLGLSRDVAQAAIVDAGITRPDINYTDRPAAGPAGPVLEQKPQAGQRADQKIDLVVSTPTSMPPLVGKPGDASRTTLEELGAVVNVEQIVDPRAAAGAVLSTVPEAGATVPTVVTLRVADPGDAMSLSTVSTIDSSSCSTASSSSVNGTTVTNNVTCSPSSSPAEATYALSRNAALLETLVGTDDREGSGTAEVVIIGDGRELEKLTVSLGKSKQISVDLRYVLRLTIRVTTRDSDNAPTVVLGDARLRGTTEQLDQIAGRR